MTGISLEEGVPTADLSAMTGHDEVAVVAACAAAVTEHGFLLLRGAFEPSALQAFRRAIEGDYAGYLDGRALPDVSRPRTGHAVVTLELEGPFGEPSFYANRYVYGVAAKLLGEAFILAHMAVHIESSNADDAPAHRDTPSLFGDGTYDALMPPVGIAMCMPLDGPPLVTRLWPGSHRAETDEQAFAASPVVVTTPPAGVLLQDVRLLHETEGKRSVHPRLSIVGAYHRNWYREWDGADGRAPISIARRHLDRVAEAHAHLFDWRFDSYGRWRLRDTFDALMSKLPPVVFTTTKRVMKRVTGS